MSRTLSLLLLCAMMLSLVFSAGASAESAMQEWRGVEWEYEPILKAVYIRCEGVMPVSNDMPWKDDTAKITAFIFDSGLTEIPAGFNDGCVSMDTIMIPATTSSIGNGVLTVGDLADLWYEGSWGEFAKIAMSDEDMAAAQKARFHGSKIVYNDDGTFDYVEEKEGGSDNGGYIDPTIERGDGDSVIVRFHSHEKDPRTGKELDYIIYASGTKDGLVETHYADGTTYTEHPKEEGSDVVYGDLSNPKLSGETVTEPDGSKTTTFKDSSGNVVYSVNVTYYETDEKDPLNDPKTKTVSRITDKDGNVTYRVLDENMQPVEGPMVVEDTPTKKTTVQLANDKLFITETVIEETEEGTKTTTTDSINDIPTKKTVIEETEEGTTTTVTTFGPDGNTKKHETVTKPDGTEIVTEYENGIPTKKTTTKPDGTEIVTTFEPDGETKKHETVTLPDGTVIDTEYENGIRTTETVTEETEEGTWTSVTTFEPDGNTKKHETVTEPDGTVIETEYAEDGETPTHQTTYRPDGTVAETVDYDEEGTPRTVTKYYEDGVTKKKVTENAGRGGLVYPKKETEYRPDGTKEKETVYNEDGRPVDIKEYAEDGETLTKETVTDLDGKTTETEFYPDGETQKKVTVTDPDDGRKVITEYAPDGTTPTKKTELRPDGTVDEVVDYDENGKAVKVTDYYTDGVTPRTVTEYTEDGDFMVKSKETEYREDGTKEKETQYDKGEPSVITEYAEDGETPTKKTEYFPNGSVVETEYAEDGETPTKDTTTESDGTKTEIQYAEDGKTPTKKVVTDPKGDKFVTDYEYDIESPKGKLHKETTTYPDGTTEVHYYNEDGKETYPSGSPIVP